MVSDRERDQMIQSRVLPYFPDERRVDQTKYDGVELAFTITEKADDFEVAAEILSVVAANRAFIFCRSAVAQADVVPTYGQSASDQLIPVAARFTEEQGIDGLASF